MRVNKPAALVAAMTLTVAAPTMAQAAPNTHEGTQALLNQALGAAPGAAVFAGDATGSWTLSAGTGNTTANTPIQPTDHFRVGSQTKTFTAAVVLQLVDEGKVALDAPIERYLPGVVDGNGYDGNTITVRELLQHESGIPTNDNQQPQANPDGTYTLAAVVRDGLRLKPDSTPGTKFEYSNTNFQIAGMLIEKITGMSVVDAITSRIITPLGLTDTTFPAGGVHTLPAPYAHGYAGQRIGPFFYWFDNTTNFEPSIYSTAGAIQSTMTDMTKFDLALASGKVVSPASLAEMRRTVPMAGAPAGYDYGLGLIGHALSCGGEAWGHAGNVLGYATWTVATDDGRYGSVVTNDMTVADDNGEDLRFQILDSAICGR
ncbi:serine hydrolase domain-containing protein [Kutzneria sp. CA-103260]|uniref:serine hydrolase domain-containing protein n=1 Tax=Kutzneria sp. CA-103260 TaxID=2802641 RepID=UPI001BA57C10|nr:serine hydrolase domain-containing protein [Kutzneria sp. CA-103260]QUQ62466.1 peptidase [Kutzneria sp. CA-103260]